VTQGLDGLWALLSAAMLLAVVRVATHLAKDRSWRHEYDFCAYLVLVGVISVAGYVAARCGAIDIYKMRYDMLSIVGAVGLAGWYLHVERSRVYKGIWVSLVLAWAVVGAVAHGQLWREYLRDPPGGGKQLIIRELEARGIRYGISPYRDAYAIAFLTHEKIIMASDRIRISSYQREVESHRLEAVRIERRRCAGGEQIARRLYLCPP